MRLRAGAGARAGRRGTAPIEFAIIAVLLFLVIFSVIEFCRMLLVYTAVANAASAGARYAIVHGGNRTGTGTNGPSGPGSTTEVVTVIRNYAGASLLDPARLSIAVTYPDTTNTSGSRVRVIVSYPYDPFTWSTLPLSVNLSSQSQGIIEF